MEEATITNVLHFLLNTSTLVVIAVVTCAYFLFRRNPRAKYHLDKIPGPKVIPVFGNALQLARPHNEILPLLKGWMETYGKTFRVWVGSFVPYAVTCDVNVIEKLVSGSTYIDKGKYDYTLLDDWLGSGLLTAPRGKWTARRKMLTPSFHFKILEDFIPIFNEQASVFLQCLERDGREGANTFNMYSYITNCTLDIICETAMGKKIYAQTSNANQAYIDAVNGMCTLITDKSLKPWLRIPIIYKMSSVSKIEAGYLKTLKQFTLQVIQAKKVERSRQKAANAGNLTSTTNDDVTGLYGKQRKAFLDLLLDAGQADETLTDGDIREEVDTFMFEGHDTTAVNLGWTVLLLAMHPECQALVHEELDEIFADDPERDVTTADIAKMKYLECCVKECLRLYPSVPLIMRQVTTDLVLDDGNIIPRDSTAMIHIHLLHHLEEHFPEPNKFIPARFLSDDIAGTAAKKRSPYAYIPFSAGSRNCIGQKFAMLEEKVVLAKLLRKYSISTKETLDSLVPVPDVVLRCQNGINVSIRKR